MRRHLRGDRHQRASALLDRRYQGILPGIGENYLRMPPESITPADEPGVLGRVTVMPEPDVPAALQAKQGADEGSTNSTTADCHNGSDKNFAAFLIRLSAAEPIAHDQMAHAPADPAQTGPAVPGSHARQKKWALPSRAKTLVMALLAVAVLGSGLLISTMRRPPPGLPAALTVQAQSPGAPVDAASKTPSPLASERSTLPPVGGGQRTSRRAAPKGAGPHPPQPVSGVEKPFAIAEIEPLPQAHPGNAVDPAPPAAMARTIPGVYFHVGSEVDRQRVSAMAAALRQQGMELVGIKIVRNGPSKPDIRYFRDDEREEALRVQKALLSIGIPVQRIKHIGGMEDRATPRLYEVWIMPGSGEGKRPPRVRAM
jgi:hypothetical protein